MLTKGGTISQIANEQSSPQGETQLSKVHVQPLETLNDEQWQEAMKINMKMLNELELDPINGSCFWINDFVEKGLMENHQRFGFCACSDMF